MHIRCQNRTRIGLFDTWVLTVASTRRGRTPAIVYHTVRGDITSTHLVCINTHRMCINTHIYGVLYVLTSGTISLHTCTLAIVYYSYHNTHPCHTRCPSFIQSVYSLTHTLSRVHPVSVLPNTLAVSRSSSQCTP